MANVISETVNGNLQDADLQKIFDETSFPSTVAYAGGAIGTAKGKERARKDL